MAPAVKIALIISVVSLIATAINSVYTARTYAKNRRLEFLQRRDHLSQKISELSDRNTEFHLISARYALVAVKNAGLPLAGEQAQQNAALIVSINQQRDGIEKGITLWDANIEKLHVIYSKLTLEHAPEVEETITLVQVASDNLKKAINGYLSTLHILETTNEFIKSSLAETDEKLRHINLDFERNMEKLEKK